MTQESWGDGGEARLGQSVGVLQSGRVFPSDAFGELCLKCIAQALELRSLHPR